MNTVGDLQKTESELRRLQQAVLSLSDLKAKEELTGKINQLAHDQETAIMNILEKTEPSYDAIVQENFDLLINDEIVFDVLREATHTSHALQLEAKILEDGLFYCHSTRTDFSLISFYPLNFVGIINYFGEADIYRDKKKYTFFSSRLPLKFIGTINFNGGLALEAMDNFFENSGKNYVNTISADLFSGDAEKRKKFLENRSQLKKKIADFRNKLN